MPNNRILAVAGGLVLFLLGLVIGLSAGGASLREIDVAVGKRLDAQAAAQTERLASIETGLGKLTTDTTGVLEGLRAGVDSSAQAVSAVGEKLGGDLAGLGQSLTGAIATSSAASLSALESGLAGVRGQLPAAAPAPAEQTAAAVAPVDPGTPPEGLSAGRTAMLSDGALRVFVTRVDDAGGAARLLVNGNDVTLSVGDSETLAGPSGECKVTLDAVDRGHAAITGACGDALPAPDGAAPGSMVDLADGLRVFVSGVTTGGARIAVNGVRTQTVAIGEAVDVTVGDQTCKVSVASIDRGRVALGYVCG